VLSVLVAPRPPLLVTPSVLVSPLPLLPVALSKIAAPRPPNTVPKALPKQTLLQASQARRLLDLRVAALACLSLSFSLFKLARVTVRVIGFLTLGLLKLGARAGPCRRGPVCRCRACWAV
jgi:hypothetical protein